MDVSWSGDHKASYAYGINSRQNNIAKGGQGEGWLRIKSVANEHVRELVMKAAAASTSISRSLTTGLVLELVRVSSRVSMNLRELI